MQIELDLDRYGADARCSAIADFAEIIAWREGWCGKQAIADLLERIGRVRYRDRHTGGILLEPNEVGFINGSDGLDPDANEVSDAIAGTPQLLVDAVWRTLDERRNILGDLYPYKFLETSIRKRRIGRHQYHALLAITIAHAFALSVPLSVGPTVEHVFERAVARCMTRPGWTVVPFGTAASGGFRAKVAAAEARLGWKMRINATVRSTAPQDAGLDVIMHMPWGDDRCGRLLLLGQATCGQSHTWGEKLAAESMRRNWGPRFQFPNAPTPVPFIAVCHHVETGIWESLHESHDGFVMDRLRLVLQPGWGHLSSEEREVIAEVLKAPMST